MSQGKHWASFDPKGDEVCFEIVVHDRDNARKICAEIQVNVPKYDPIEQDMAIPVRGNPLTTYAIITSGEIEIRPYADITVIGDMYAYEDLELHSSQLSQYGNFYTSGGIHISNDKERSHYNVYPYGSKYDNEFKKKLYFGNESLGQNIYINNVQLVNNYSITMHTKLWSFIELFIGKSGNPASLIFRDSLGGNIYCKDLVTDERNIDDPNLILEGGALTLKLRSAADKIDTHMDVQVDDPLKKVNAYHDYVNLRAYKVDPLGGYYPFFYTFVYEHYLESKFKNGGIDMKTKHKSKNQIDEHQKIIEYNQFTKLIDKDYSDKLGTSGVTYSNDSNYEVELVGNEVVEGIYYCDGNLAIKGNGTIKGAIIAEGDVRISGQVKVIHDKDVLLESYGKDSDVSAFFRKGEIGNPIASTTVKAENARARVAVNEKRYKIMKWVLE